MGAVSAQPSARPARQPGTPATPSGRLLLRMPSGLHAELARTAARERCSLNAFITRSLAAAVGWDEGAAPRRARAPRDRVALLLAANAAAVALAALAAVAILLVAWLG